MDEAIANAKWPLVPKADEAMAKRQQVAASESETVT